MDEPIWRYILICDACRQFLLIDGTADRIVRWRRDWKSRHPSAPHAPPAGALPETLPASARPDVTQLSVMEIERWREAQDHNRDLHRALYLAEFEPPPVRPRERQVFTSTPLVDILYEIWPEERFMPLLEKFGLVRQRKSDIEHFDFRSPNATPKRYLRSKRGVPPLSVAAAEREHEALVRRYARLMLSA